MKGDIYYLRDSDGYIVAKFEQTSNYMDGVCYECNGWNGNDCKTPCEWSFFADVYCKFDGCTHWYFYGEDYDLETGNEKDSYYHICGDYCFLNHVRYMCFIWKLAEQILVEITDRDGMRSSRYVNDEYSGNAKLKQLVDSMLEGYTIEKEDREK